MSSSRTILVTGATGKQGGATIQSLLASSAPFNIVAVTRDKNSRGAKTLASQPNITVVEGDLSNPKAFFDQAGPVWGVFGVQINSDEEEQQGKALIDAAVAHGVEYFVYASGDRGGPERSATDPTFVKNFAAKFHIEKHLEGKAQFSKQKMTWTILRPVTFFENQTEDRHGKGFNRMWEQMNPKRLQMISTKDIGWFAANAFIHSDEHKNTALTLVGDELNWEEADAIYKEVTGREMAMVPCPIGSAIKFFLKGTVGDMFRWFETNGYGGDVEACRKTYPSIQTYRTWLIENRK